MGNLLSLFRLWKSAAQSSQGNGYALPKSVPSPRKRKIEKRRKKIRFSKTMEEIFFGRKAQYDRFPRDGIFWPLGMSSHHFYRRTCPLPQTDNQRTRSSHPVFLPALQREEMLTPSLPPRGLTPSQESRRQELQTIWDSRHHSGCSCLRGCEAESCECLQEGVACSSVRDSLAGWRGCCCFLCPCANISHRDRVLRRTVQEHYRRTFARLLREQREEERRKKEEDVSVDETVEEEEEEEEDVSSEDEMEGVEEDEREEKENMSIFRGPRSL